ncbi:MAG TPA: hypothetical protein VGE12_04070 [Noviherbaspirillum sp.]
MLNRTERKKHLIAQGAIYRAEVMLARHEVKASLRPESIARNAVHHAVLVGLAALKARNLSGMPGLNLQNLQSLLPLAMSSVSALSKNKALVKVVLRGAIIAGSVAGVVRVLSKRKKKSVVEASGEPSGYPME